MTSMILTACLRNSTYEPESLYYPSAFGGYDESTTVPEEVQIFPAAVGPLGYGTGNTRLLNINFCALEDIHLIQ